MMTDVTVQTIINSAVCQDYYPEDDIVHIVDGLSCFLCTCWECDHHFLLGLLGPGKSRLDPVQEKFQIVPVLEKWQFVLGTLLVGQGMMILDREKLLLDLKNIIVS